MAIPLDLSLIQRETQEVEQYTTLQWAQYTEGWDETRRQIVRVLLRKSFSERVKSLPGLVKEYNGLLAKNGRSRDFCEWSAIMTGLSQEALERIASTFPKRKFLPRFRRKRR